MQQTLQVGDVVKTKAGDYGVVLKTKPRASDVEVDIDLIGRGSPVTFFQSKLELITKVADVPEELQLALIVRVAKLQNAEKPKNDIFTATSGRKSTSVSNIGVEGCMAHFKDWLKKKVRGAVGFRDKEFIFDERTYREKCAELFYADLNKSAFENLLAAKNYEDIFAKATAIYTKRKTPDGIECMLNYVTDQYGSITHYKEAIFEKGADRAKKWAELLYDVLYGEDAAKAFDAFASFHSSRAFKDRWPLTTVYLQLRDMKKYLCVKPDFFATVAASMGYEGITGFSLPSMNGKVSWKGYQQYLQFGEWLKQQLKAWKEPEWALSKDGDMLDIQAFCFIVYTQRQHEI